MFLELLLQLVCEFLIDVILHAMSRFTWVRVTISVARTVIRYFGLGLFVGLLSLCFFPKAFIHSSSLHGISLVITPLLAGFTMSAIGWIRVRRGDLRIPLETFSYGFIFAFAMALMRLFFTD